VGVRRFPSPTTPTVRPVIVDPDAATGPCMNNVLAPSLRDSVTNLWNPYSPR
jgi:hypothetical protein